MIDYGYFSKIVFPALHGEMDTRETCSPSILIVDGIVASGKTTFVNNFKRYLERQGNHVAVIQTDWFLTFPENQAPYYLFIWGLFIKLALGMRNGVFTRYLSTFFDLEEINAIIGKIQNFGNGMPNAESVSIQIRNRVRQVDEVLVIKPNTAVFVEGVFSSVLFDPLSSSQTLLILKKSSLARSSFIERSRQKRSERLGIFMQSIFQLPPGIAHMHNGKTPAFDYILEMNDLSNPNIVVTRR